MLEFCRYLRLQTIWADDGLLYVEAVVLQDAWSGKAKTYTNRDSILQFATQLETFVEALNGEASFVSGEDSSLGLVGIRFYTVDWSGHVACHVRLQFPAGTSRPEESFRFEVESPVEPCAIKRFLASLKTITNEVGWSAQLDLEYSPALS